MSYDYKAAIERLSAEADSHGYDGPNDEAMEAALRAAAAAEMHSLANELESPTPAYPYTMLTTRTLRERADEIERGEA